MKQDWHLIEATYLNSNKSYKALADEFEVSLSTLTKRAAKENWTQKKQNISSKVAAEIADKIIAVKSEKVFDAIAKIDTVIENCENWLNTTHPKSWEGVAALMLKAIAMRHELTVKTTEVSEWDNDGSWD